MAGRRFFSLYQYLGPLLLTPLACWLWWHTCQGDWRLMAQAVALPIVYAYIVPGVGTNVLKVWEFDTRFRLGRFRVQHGFVFGSATAVLAWLCHGGPARGLADAAATAVVFGGVLGFVNILYDIRAIESGLLRVYNQPWADGRGAEAIAMDYAPWFFGGFGAAYGLALALAEWWVASQSPGPWVFAVYFLVSLAFVIAVPVLGYRRRSLRLYGHDGCRPIPKGSRSTESTP
ncbi:MAG: hypothetical protein LBQ32_09900 [Burkholderiaceae bacterium]|jgi:hypothetical protein|nr:hypothetical protein [Burkholderiaceae bacterium]